MFFMSVKRFMFDFANLLFNVQTGIITTIKKNVRLIILYTIHGFHKKSGFGG